MTNKLKNHLLLWGTCAWLFTACQEPEVIHDPTGNASGKPVFTIGNGNRVFITSNTTWTSNNIYLLNGEVVVRNASLTIQPGTIIMGREDPNPNDNFVLNSSLIIDTNAQLFAQGTPTDPIIFTSDQPIGARDPGDWGGVILLGNDIVNQGARIEGLESPLSYGGSGDNRTQGSGVLSYVRIEYAGNLLRNSSRSNGLTLAGVGANTTVNHLQVSFCREDSFEFFGGSVSARFLVSWQCRDDDFDTELGHSGTVQYAVSRRSDRGSNFGSNGIETENDGLGTNSTPGTNTLFANITFIGPGELAGDGTEIPTGGGVRGSFNAGMLIRRNSATNLLNSIITAWPIGTNLRDFTTAENYVIDNALKLEGITVGLPRNGGAAIRTDNLTIGEEDAVLDRYFNLGQNAVFTASAAAGTTVASIVGLSSAAFATGTRSADGTNPAGTPNFILSPNAANLTNAVPLPTNAVSRGLIQENFRGAFDTDGIVTGGNWNFSSGWLEFDPGNAVYH